MRGSTPSMVVRSQRLEGGVTLSSAVEASPRSSPSSSARSASSTRPSSATTPCLPEPISATRMGDTKEGSHARCSTAELGLYPLSVAAGCHGKEAHNNGAPHEPDSLAPLAR